MKRAIFAALAVLVMSIGLASAPNSGTAQAYTSNNVQNAPWSASNLLVCGSGECTTLIPGTAAYQGSYWSPDSVAVCPYCTGSYRAILSNGYTTGWVHQSGGRFGTWIDAAAVHRMWGGNGVRVQVAMSNPNY